MHKLDLFFPQYIQSLYIERADIVDAFDGIQVRECLGYRAILAVGVVSKSPHLIPY